jgi:glycosyl hydrolase family 9/cellulase-like Ig domain-containing protein
MHKQEVVTYASEYLAKIVCEAGAARGRGVRVRAFRPQERSALLAEIRSPAAMPSGRPAMKRRRFLLAPAASVLKAWQKPQPLQILPAEQQRLETLRPAPKPAIALNHLGFLPKARKIVIYRLTGGAAPAEFSVQDIGQPPQPFRLVLPLEKVTSDFGNFMVGDFSELERDGMYQVTVAEERSVPFFIRLDVWRRTLPKAVSYFRAQRCGVAVPNFHPACHLDDARRRDNGEYVETTGGWHDAGDLRKWLHNTLYGGFGLMYLARNLGGKWDLAGSGLTPLLEEMRWGNRYFLKMQDNDGLVWSDVGGGVNDDNSDNHWTDNRIGTEDDRYLNPFKIGYNQAMFSSLQALVAQAFRRSDPGYAQSCLEAGIRCWQGAGGKDRCWPVSSLCESTTELSWWTVAALELYRATRKDIYRTTAEALGEQLLSRQTTGFIGSQEQVRGFWRASGGGAAPYLNGMPPFALLELLAVFPEQAQAGRWRDAVRRHLDECILPLTARSVYRIVPFGLYLGSPTQELYRPLAGQLTYRYFKPTGERLWASGTTSHIEGYAAVLARAGKVFGNREYTDLAYRQLEWLMGANPFGACLMTGEGMRNPYPHSRYVGLIVGGLPNGIAGDRSDEPVLDTQLGFDWRTVEYCTPHNAHYIWTISELER